MPRYWVNSADVQESIPKGYIRKWFMGFKDVTSPTNERTMIISTIPYSAVGNTLPLIMTMKEVSIVCGLIANFSSFVLDFVVRQNIGGVHLNFFLVKQFPVIKPESYYNSIINRVVPAVSKSPTPPGTSKPSPTTSGGRQTSPFVLPSSSSGTRTSPRPMAAMRAQTPPPGPR